MSAKPEDSTSPTQISQLLISSCMSQQMKSKLSHLIHSIHDFLLTYSLKLYQQAIITIAGEALEEMQERSILVVQKQEEQMSISIKASLDLNSKLSSNQNQPIQPPCALSPRSQIHPQHVILTLKPGISYELCFQLFRGYSVKKKLEIIEDYGFKIMFKDKSTRRFGSILDCIKPLGDPTINITYTPSQNSLRIQLIERSKYKQSHPHYITLMKHVSDFRKQLWSYGCLQVEEEEIGQFLTETIDRVMNLVSKKQNEREDGTLDHIIRKYILIKNNIVVKYQSSVVSGIDSAKEVEIQKEITLRLGVYKIFREYYANEYQQFKEGKERVLNTYSLLSLLNKYNINRNISIPDLLLPDSTLKLLESTTIHENVRGVHEFESIVGEISNREGGRENNTLFWVIVYLLCNNTERIFHHLKILDIYFKNQAFYKEQEQFTLTLLFALDYIRNCIEKQLLVENK